MLSIDKIDSGTKYKVEGFNKVMSVDPDWIMKICVERQC